MMWFWSSVQVLIIIKIPLMREEEVIKGDLELRRGQKIRYWLLAVTVWATALLWYIVPTEYCFAFSP